MLRVYLIVGLILSVSGLGTAAAVAIRAEAETPSEKQSPTKTPPIVVEEQKPIDPLKGIDVAKMERSNGRYSQTLDDGRKATFTVEPTLQRFADDMFDSYRVPAGAAVILNSRTGRVLALSQRRGSARYAEIPAVALDPSPPAASLFKIVTAAALLEKGNVETGTKTCYRGGSSRLLLEHLEDAPRAKSACASLGTALGRSINAIFAKLADRRLERGILSEYAKRFGFNRPLPFDVPIKESIADIPKDRLERARTAAGFWHTHLSPLHAAMMVQSLAQKGAMLRPYVVEKVSGEDGALLHEAKPKYLRHTVDEKTAKALVRAMTSTVRRGTARKAFRDRRGVPYLPNVEVSGKTGTLMGKKPYRAYTWFAGTAPADHPEVAIAVLVVNEPKWRIKASSAAAQLLKKYFEVTRKRKE